MLKKSGIALVATLISTAAFGQTWPNLPILGGAAYCSSTVNNVCVSTVPAGPAMTGAETLPADTNITGGASPQTVKIPLVNFGIGPAVTVTTVGTTQTIPNNTPYYVLNGAQGSAFTVTMPAVASDGFIQHVICQAATVGTFTAAANTGQTMAPASSPAAACAAGVGYSWRFNLATTTWLRIQ